MENCAMFNKATSLTENTPMLLVWLFYQLYYLESTAKAKDGKDGPPTEAVEDKQASNLEGTGTLVSNGKLGYI